MWTVTILDAHGQREQELPAADAVEAWQTTLEALEAFRRLGRSRSAIIAMGVTGRGGWRIDWIGLPG